MKILHLSRLTLISLLCANLCWGEVYEGFYTMTHDKNTNKVLNSFGVRTAFITTMADDEKAQKILEKWQYFVNKFDSSYEFIPISKVLWRERRYPKNFCFLPW